MLKAIFMLSAGVILCACISQKKPPYTSIKFGAGGGFTGAVVSYELRDGTIYRSDHQDSIKVLSTDELNLVDDHLNRLNETAYNKPANMSQFIEVSFRNETVVYQWGINSEDTPSELAELYQLLTRHVQ